MRRLGFDRSVLVSWLHDELSAASKGSYTLPTSLKTHHVYTSDVRIIYLVL